MEPDGWLTLDLVVAFTHSPSTLLYSYVTRDIGAGVPGRAHQAELALALPPDPSPSRRRQDHYNPLWLSLVRRRQPAPTLLSQVLSISSVILFTSTSGDPAPVPTATVASGPISAFSAVRKMIPLPPWGSHIGAEE